MDFSKEVGRFTINEAAQHQVEIIYLTEMLRDNFFLSLPRYADEKLINSYDILKPSFDSNEKFQGYVERKMQKTLDSFDKAIWSSLFTYSYFNLEKDFIGLCKKIEKEIDSKITLANLNGRGIKRSKLFLIKLAEVNFKELNEGWVYIINCKEIRNCITHNGGSIKKSNKRTQIRNFCEQNDGINLEEEILSISPNFIIDTCDKLYNFWLAVSGQLIPKNSEWA